MRVVLTKYFSATKDKLNGILKYFVIKLLVDVGMIMSSNYVYIYAQKTSIIILSTWSLI